LCTDCSRQSDYSLRGASSGIGGAVSTVGEARYQGPVPLRHQRRLHYVSLLNTRHWATIAGGFLLVTLVMASPLVDLRHLTDASYQGDARLIIWTLAWDAHALLTGSPLFAANMFYPAAEALSWAEHHVGIAMFALPVDALTGNPVLAYWVVWLLAFPLNALAAYALAYRVTRDSPAAFGAGLVYAFCFFRMHHGHGHLQLLWTWALPLVPLALERWVERPSLPRAVLAAALVLVQALSGWYVAVAVALLSMIAAPLLLWARRLTFQHVVSGLVVSVASVLTLAWFARPYMRLRAGGAEEARSNAADLAAYLVPPANTWLGQWVGAHTSLTPRWIWGEQTVYVGLIPLGFAVVGLWTWRHRRDRLSGAVLLTGAAALLLSFGPGGGWSPFDLLTQLPGMSLVRAPARFALLVMLAMALLVAFGAAQLRVRLKRRAPAVLVLLALIGLSESYVIGFPGGKPAQLPVPEVYRRLKALPPGPLLSLPSYRATPEAFREADYLLFSTAHWQPIVNGYGRQEPPSHGETMATIARFPAPAAVQKLREIGVRYVVVHTGRASELRQAVLDASANRGVTLLGRFEEDYLYGISWLED
jgi:hypothetical protein